MARKEKAREGREGKEKTLTPSHSLGKRGEALAVRHFVQLGASVMAKNYACREGEIDIVAQLEAFIVFVEVKTRTKASLAYHPSLAVDAQKQQHLRLAAQRYMLEHSITTLQPRFDVICISGRGPRQHLEHLPNAF